MYASPREDTTLRPFKLIPGAYRSRHAERYWIDDFRFLLDGVHHFDENGLRNIEDEPPHIQKIHREIVGFVTEWLKDWKAPEKK